MTRRLGEDGYNVVMGTDKQLVGVRNDFLCCPECKSIQLYMGTTPFEIVQNTHSVVIQLTCNECSTKSELALFNDHVGLDKLVTRINWVQKTTPYVMTTHDKLRQLSLTGFSSEFRAYVDKYDLWDYEVGESLPEGVPPFKKEDYREIKETNVVSMRDEE
jgi:hypothetical protein